MWRVKKIIAYTIMWTPVIICLLLLSLCAGMETPTVDESLLTTVIRGLGRITLVVVVIIGLGLIIHWAEKVITEDKTRGS